MNKLILASIVWALIPLAVAGSFPRTATASAGVLPSPAISLPAISYTLPGVSAITVTAGYGHSCVLTAGHGVMCWGHNEYGELGDGTTSNRNAATDVAGITSGARFAAAGGKHSCAAMNNGEVRCWGLNNSGQLGDNSTTNRSSPVVVNGIGGPVEQLAIGDSHTCALVTGGTVKCWGWNKYGQLGDNTTTDRPSPVQVSGLGGVIAISAGGSNTCALVTGGGVMCWGANFNGQIGDGTTTQRSTPAAVSGLSGVKDIAVGYSFACALTGGNGVKCWGDNTAGDLGDGTTTQRPLPEDVSGLSSGVQGIGTGDKHACAILVGGNLVCWGRNDYAQLGDGTMTESHAPVAVAGIPAGATAVDGGSEHTCAVVNSAVRCWGNGMFSALGDGTDGSRGLPVAVTGLGTGVQRLDAGGARACAVSSSNGLVCWGSSDHSPLDPATIHTTPAAVVGISGTVSAIALGSFHACVLYTSGAVACWGDNSNGQLGDGTTSPHLTPAVVTGLESGVAKISAGPVSTCALMQSQTVKCWGYNQYGQLGDGTTEQRNAPVDVVGLDNVQAITLANLHTCALMTSGGVKCWGSNFSYELGDGTSVERHSPVDVLGLSGVSAIGAGSDFTCALKSGGVQCWGRIAAQLPLGSLFQSYTPADVSGLTTGVADLSATGQYVCVRTVAQGVICFGNNKFGQLGDSTTVDRSAAVDVVGLPQPVQTVALGSTVACALSTTGSVFCWGDNDFGELGNGSRHFTPTDVAGLSGGAHFLYLPLLIR